jgi:Predicted nucleic acid-binding protein, contains PIN domain
MILDTDILIWYMRGNDRARKIIEESSNFHVSVVTYIEMVQGLRSKTELRELRKAFKEWNTSILFINEEISAKALFYVERFFLSHFMTLADALIAATAVTYAIPLLTGNERHYRMISELEIRKFRP